MTKDWKRIATELGHCRHTGAMKLDWALMFRRTTEVDNLLVYVDMGNLHALNHAIGMRSSTFWMTECVKQLRHSDVVRVGGDEWALVVGPEDVDGLLDRLTSMLTGAGLYATVVVTRCSGDLEADITEADEHCERHKLLLERTGAKPERRDGYRMLTTDVLRFDETERN
jgi:predicted signal transduction protein with EAL and GGDEF domain